MEPESADGRADPARLRWRARRPRAGAHERRVISVATRRLSDVPGGDAEADDRKRQEVLRRTAFVVTLLQPGLQRAAGLDTYLSAMALGELVIVSESPGARDYVDDRRTGLVVPAGETGPLREALAWALDPANADDVVAVAGRAAETARTRFTYEAYVATLLRVVDDVTPLARVGRPGPFLC